MKQALKAGRVVPLPAHRPPALSRGCACPCSQTEANTSQQVARKTTELGRERERLEAAMQQTKAECDNLRAALRTATAERDEARAALAATQAKLNDVEKVKDELTAAKEAHEAAEARMAELQSEAATVKKPARRGWF